MADALLSPGTVVGGSYEAVRPLGSGGMGEVWLAKHLRVPGKQVAIKVLRVLADAQPDDLARFRREAEIAARLEHPNIVQVYDFATLPSGAPYIVMEALRGETLSARLSRGPLPLAELQALVVQVGSALHAAHAAGVVHRDLKPANIFLVATPTGVQAKVLDFGISKLIDSQTLQTSSAVIMGTPQYMSPEQASAEHRAITGQSDVFSLATVCFEALTGRRPFAADSLARVVYLVTVGPSPSLRVTAPEQPAHVAAALDHALAKALADRTPDVATFVKELCGVTFTAAAAPSDNPFELPVARAPAPPTAVTVKPAPRPGAVASPPGEVPREADPTVGQRPSSKSRVGANADARPTQPGRRPMALVVALGVAAAAGALWFARRETPVTGDRAGAGAAVPQGVGRHESDAGAAVPQGVTLHDVEWDAGAAAPQLVARHDVESDAGAAVLQVVARHEVESDAGAAAPQLVTLHAAAGDAGAVAAAGARDAGLGLRRASPAQPAPLGPLSPEQAELLSRARAAAAKGLWNEVLDWALKPAVSERPEAITLRLLAWCSLGDLSLVNAYKAKLSPADRPAVARACQAQGISL